jgi:hypothetical protein
MPHNAGELWLGRDARAVWSAHNEERARGCIDAGLFSLEQWARNLPSTYEFHYATVVPPEWPRARPMSLDEYKARFEARFGDVISILRSTQNVCVCGGAALSPFCDQADDVDVFVFGLDERGVWLKAQELADKIRAAYPRARRISQELAPGVLTVRVYDVANVTIQIMMRVYESMARVAYSFDIGVCGVAFDGNDVYMTRLAAFELLHRLIVVVPAYRSPSFGHRLAKYHKRGFALAMLDASFARVSSDGSGPKKGEPFVVGDLRVLPSFACGRMLVAAVSAATGATVSDYEPRRPWSSRSRFNVYQLVSPERRFVVGGTLSGRSPRPLTLAAFADTPLTLRDVLSKQDLCEALRAFARASVSRCGKVNVRILRRVFRLSDAELSAFTLAASGALLTARRVDASESLRRFSTPILELYDSLPQRIQWVLAPGASSSRTPTSSTPEEWYGALFAKVRAPSKDETIAVLHARMCAFHHDLGALDGTCALCFGEVHARGKNTVTLRCRHTFHFGQTDSGCRGLSAWAAKREDCPLCRQPFGNPEPEEPELDLSLEVAWPAA